MAPTSSDERADTPQVQKQRQRSRIPSTAASQPPQARKKKASKPRPQKEPEYNLRKLLQERVEKGRTEYLVDWEDAEDGTPYPPSWEPKRNINALALAEWNEEKKQKNRKATGSRQNTPVHTGKRKRGSRQSSSAISEDIPTPKRPRRPEETRAASITELEIPDSYEQAQPGLSATSYLQVVVPLPTAEFDRSAYTKALTSSQRSEFSASKNSSGGTFQSLPESFRTGSSGCSVPQEPSENPRTYRKGLSIRDLIIPDSQDYHWSSSYKPSGTTASKELSGSTNQDQSAEKGDKQSRSERRLLTPSREGSAESINLHASSPSVTSASNPRAESFLDSQPTPPAETQSPSGPSVHERAALTESSTAAPVLKPKIVEPDTSVAQDSSVNESECFLTQQPLSSPKVSEEIVGEYDFPSVNSQAAKRPVSVPVNETSENSSLLESRLLESRSQTEPTAELNSETPWQGAQITSPLAPVSTQYSSQGLGAHTLIDDSSTQLGTSQQRSRERSGGSVSDHVLPSVESPEATILSITSAEPQQPLDATTEGTASRSPSATMDSQAGYPATQPRLSIKEQLARARQSSSLQHAPILPQLDGSPEPQGFNIPAPKTRSESPTSNDVSEADSPDTEDQLLPLAAKEYLIPLPLVSWVRDMYKTAIRGYENSIRNFLNEDQPDEALFKKMNDMANALNAICSHPDLLDPNASIGSLTDQEQAGYAENSSTKCMLLYEMLTEIQESSVHVAVLAESAAMLDIIETICRFHKFEYTRPDRGVSAVDVVGSLRVTILSTKTFSDFSPIRKLNAVIVFDGHFGRDQLPSLQGPGPMEELIREQILLISLRVANSIEHLNLCIPQTSDTLDTKKRLVRCLVKTTKDVGDMEVDISSMAKSAGWFITNKGRDPWPIEELPYIRDIEQFLAPSHSSLAKRPLTAEDASTDESSKRLRLTPQPESDIPMIKEPESGDAVSVAQQDGNDDEVECELDRSDNVVPDSIASNALLEKISALEIQNSDYKGQLESANSVQIQMEKQIKELEKHVADLERSVRIIQPKYQEALNDRGQFEHSNQGLVRENETVSRQLEVRNKEKAKLKEENEALKSELLEARAMLSSSSIPEVVELSKAKEEVQVAKTAAEKANKKMTNAQSEADYLRENYQQASSKASEAARETQALKIELEKLQHMASANLVHIHQMQHASESKHLVARITELETLLSERTRDLDRKSEELRVRMNGRRETRGVSAPRSPRISNGTMSPRTVDRIVGNASRSRGSSPSASGIGMPPPPPNEGAFRSDPMFLPPVGGARWNHLQ